MIRRVAVGAVVVLAVAAGAWWMLTEPEQRPQIRPAKTMRALELRWKRPLLGPPAQDPVQAPDDEDDEEPLRLHVRLDRHWQASIDVSEALSLAVLPESYWPRDDEVPFPDLESVHLLQDAVDGQLEREIRSNYPLFSEPNAAYRAAFTKVQTLIEAGEDDGLIPEGPVWDTELAEDPWTLLHQAQLLRTAEMSTQLTEEMRPGQEDRGYLLAESGWLAEHLVALDPDHPASDYARLLGIESTVQRLYTDAAAPQLAVDAVTEALGHSDDPLVLETALLAMVGADADKFEGADTTAMLDEVRDVLPTMGTDVQQVVGLQALEIAIRTSPDQVAGLLALATEVGADSEELDEAVDDLAVRGLQPVKDWRTELARVARDCHAEAPVVDVRFVLHGRWGGGWSLRIDGVEPYLSAEAIVVPRDWVRCMEDHAWAHDPPRAALEARVSGAPSVPLP